MFYRVYVCVCECVSTENAMESAKPGNCFPWFPRTCKSVLLVSKLDGNQLTPECLDTWMTVLHCSSSTQTQWRVRCVQKQAASPRFQHIRSQIMELFPSVHSIGFQHAYLPDSFPLCLPAGSARLRPRLCPFTVTFSLRRVR